MKNKIILLIDSLGDYELENLIPTMMPFTYSIMQNSVTYTNMISQGPYTEAALSAFYTGKDTMDNGGYLLKFNDRHTFLEELQSMGYTVYKNIDPQVHAQSAYKDCDVPIYSVAFDIEALWGYRLEYYYDLYHQDKLVEIDYIFLKKLIGDCILFLIKQFKMLMQKDNSLEFITNNTNIDSEEINNTIDLLEDEYKLFENDSKQYLDDLLSKGKNHSLFTVNKLKQDHKIQNQDIKKEVINEYKTLFDEIKKSNRKHIPIFRIETFKNLIELLLHSPSSKIKNALKYIYLYLVYGKFDKDLLSRNKETYDSFKSAPSITTHIDHFINWANEQTKPYAATIHVDDIHNPEIFFTYDSENLDLMKEELNHLNNVLKKIPKNYTGSITYLLSLAYVDSKIEYLFDKLKENNIYDNTEIYITGDHGFSFSYRFNRKNYVTNFYLENYKVPFIIHNKYDSNEIRNQLCSSKDIYNLITDSNDINIHREYVTMEYMGGGCPDLLRRPVLLTYYNQKYMFCFEATYKNKFQDIQIYEAYDLK
ncbi:sulfatase-like hydrolase/transferase, partial [Coprobacillus cateniformis]